MKTLNLGTFMVIVALCQVFVTPLRADTDHITIREDNSCHNVNADAALLGYINQTDATLASPQDSRNILDAILKKSGNHGPIIHSSNKALDCPANAGPATGGGAEPGFSAADFFCLIHIFRWKDPSTTDNKKPMAPDKQNWYVYHAGAAWRLEDFKGRNRIFGSKNVWLLFVHLNARSDYPYEVRYDIDAKDIIPAPLSDGLSLAQLFAGGAAQNAEGEKQNLIGMYSIGVTHLPNEMSVQAEQFFIDTANKNTPTLQNLSDSAVKFINEGRYHFDFGVAVPIRKISQTTIDTTNNSVTPKATGTTNAFGVIDIYPYANDIRTGTPTLSYIPYLIGGVAMGQQPLHKILVAVGWGPKVAQFYFGSLLVKQESAKSMSPAVVDSGYEPQFSFGINLTVRGFRDLTKKK